MPRNFWLFIFVGLLDLILGLGLAIYTGISQSWLLGGIIALGFFCSANFLFYMAYKKLG